MPVKDSMGRFANVNWNVSDDNNEIPWDRLQFALLMDLRDELRAINRTLQCASTQAMPGLLRRIARNTTKKKPSRAGG